MGRKAKDKFSKVPPEFKETVNHMSIEEIKAKVSETALGLEELLQAQEKDFDLLEKKAAATEAGRVYSEGKAAARAKIAYCRFLLETKGAI